MQTHQQQQQEQQAQLTRVSSPSWDLLEDREESREVRNSYSCSSSGAFAEHAALGTVCGQLWQTKAAQASGRGAHPWDPLKKTLFTSDWASELHYVGPPQNMRRRGSTDSSQPQNVV